MPGFVIHAFIPTLAMLAMRRYFDPRIVLLLWPMTILPDADYFFGVHRATTTSLFFVAGVLLLTLALARAFDRPRAWLWTGTAAAYMLSHLVMDVFTGGVVLLYPVSDYTTCWFFYIEAVTATNDVTVYWEPCSHEGAPVVSPVYPVLDANQAAMVVFLVAAWGVYAGARGWEAWRGRRASPPSP